MKGFGGASVNLRSAFFAARTHLLAFGIIVGVCSSVHAVSPGDILTVAGGGVGDGGAATSASFVSPQGVTIDGYGNLYIADCFNNRIRKVAADSGIITTVAGNGSQGFSGDDGPATSAALFRPSAVTVDSAGNLYIADQNNNRIRKVTAGTGIITTVAGNGNMGFYGDGVAATSTSLFKPFGVKVDGTGNIYIADIGNYRIRRVDASSGVITTVAGNGTPSFAGDGGPATAASLYYPTDMTVDSAGNLYIADSGNHRVRKVFAGSGIITTVAGNGTQVFAGDGGPAASASLNYPYGVTVDNAGNLYVADTYNNRIRKVASDTGIISTVAGNGNAGFSGDGGVAVSASLYMPFETAVDSSGNVFILDGYNNRIRKVDSGSGIITTVAGNGLQTPDFISDGGQATTASLNSPFDVAVDSGGNLYIADSYNQRIRKVAAGTGVITTVAGNGNVGTSGDDGPAISARFNTPSAVTLDNSGNLYIADFNNQRIRRVAADTGIITTVAGNGTRDFSGDGGPATSASLAWVSGMAIDGAGNLFIADNYNNRIRKVAAGTGIITTVAGNGTYDFAGDDGPATSASFKSPQGVAVDSSGNLFISDYYNHRIRKVDAYSGIITTVAGTGTEGFSGDGGPATSASLYSPSGVVVDKAGNLLFSDTGNGRIRKVDADTGVITTLAGIGGRFAGDGGPAVSAEIYWPHGLALDGAGNLYIADSGNNRIRKIIMNEVSSPSVTTDTASAISATGAILNGLVNNFISDATINFDYGLTASYGSSVSDGTVTAGSGNRGGHAAITALACNTTYHFRVVAVNSAGRTNGLDQTFSTSPCPVNGACGINNGLSLTVAPSTNLCSTGIPSALTGTGPWSWTCNGSNGGTTANCSAGIQTFAVTFAAGTNGTLTGATSQMVNYGVSASPVTAVPATGCHFVNWTGTGGFAATTANPLTVTGIAANHDIRANFAIDAFLVTPTANTNGTITPNVAQSVSSNGTATFAVAPATGYYIASVAGCGGSLSGNSYVTSAINGNCTVTAGFSLIPDGIMVGSSISISDALRALKIAIGLIIPTAFDLAHGDVAPLVNGEPQPDLKIDVSDALVILRKTIGLVTW